MLLSLTLALAVTVPQGTTTVNAGRGPITVNLPANYDPADPAPLIVLLHGYGASGAIQEQYMKFLNVQDTYGFIFCAPDGTTDFTGNRFWNGAGACCDFANTGVDDSAYLRALIEAIEVAASVDPRSIHLIGHSNGGFMAYRMACEHPDKIASIASLAGATFNNPANCNSTTPTHVLQIHGTADSTILYGGGSLLGVPYPSAMGTALQWAQKNGCDPTPVDDPVQINLDSNVAGPESTITRFPNNCEPGGTVELWTIQGGSHTPGITPMFRNLVVQHLLARPMPVADSTRYCSPASPNSSGLPASIQVEGSDVVVDNALGLVAEDLPTNQFGYFLGSQTSGFSNPMGSQGSLCLAGQIARFNAAVQSSGAMGTFALEIDLMSIPTSPPVAALIGETWNFQAWFRDANPTPTSNFTDAVSVVLR
ncbi:MAG: polyhydroxybutyrate depolymerase [Planctomycetota bacterium]|jgi:polyhydroxybutyrate depolymerase